ncbi:MAG: hypothetical protein KDD33_04275 [Bdellovibrionales bacterium]|nr:hypothetical protein [Bdellovibrionales bacterium]
MGLREKKIKENDKSRIAGSMVYAPSEKLYTPQIQEDETLELDVIERLKSNISMLEDLNSRLGFMNKEIENIIGAKITQ